MTEGLEAQLRAIVDEAIVRIIAEDPIVQKLTALAMGKNVGFESDQEPDFDYLTGLVDRKYGAQQHLLDQAMTLIEDDLEGK